MFANTRRALRVALLTFVISLVISYATQFSLAFWLSLLVLFIVIALGIFFDIIGTSVTAATESPFHAMGADRVKGYRQALYLVRHADRVANFCNDVVGDISGTIGGALVAAITLEFVRSHAALPSDILRAATIALTAAVTVGGKALGKSYAIERANRIVFWAGRMLAFLKINVGLKKKSKRKVKPKTRKAR